MWRDYRWASSLKLPSTARLHPSVSSLSDLQLSSFCVSICDRSARFHCRPPELLRSLRSLISRLSLISLVSQRNWGCGEPKLTQRLKAVTFPNSRSSPLSSRPSLALPRSLTDSPSRVAGWRGPTQPSARELEQVVILSRRRYSSSVCH